MPDEHLALLERGGGGDYLGHAVGEGGGDISKPAASGGEQRRMSHGALYVAMARLAGAST